ncbi:MAG: glyoxylase-like metal-dependent hydrolase (beta-lactamase superfamily II) [Planctomycetota bacterium]
MKIGSYDLTAVEAGTMKLDGGAMFGSVPKALWQREHPADDSNCIQLSCRILMIKGKDRLLIVDSGMGDKWTAKERTIFGIAPDYPPLETALARAGFDPNDVTDVIITHLHFDHAGGLTRHDQDGNLTPAFPKAVHWLQSSNLENAKNPNPRERASYRSENFDFLEQVDLRLLNGASEIAPGIDVFISNGHTQGMQLVRVSGKEGSVTYCADLIPTASHVHGAYTMGYDINAGLLIEEKAKVLSEVMNDGGMLFFEHDPKGAMGGLKSDNRRIKFAGYVDDKGSLQ